MATTVSTVLNLDIKATEKRADDLGTAQKVHSLVQSAVYATGTGSNQQDLAWSDTRSAAAAADTIDLAGSLTDALGGTLTFAEITAIVIVNKATTTGKNLTIGAGSNPLVNWVSASGDAVVLGPGGIFVWTSPIDGAAVTAATGDILTIDPGSDTISYDILILGRSA